MVAVPRPDRWTTPVASTSLDSRLPAVITDPTETLRSSRFGGRRRRPPVPGRSRRRAIGLGLSALFFFAVFVISSSTLRIGDPPADDDGSEELARAFELQSAGDLDGAAELYREAIAKDSSTVVGHFNLGVVEGTRGNDDTAALEYERVIALDGDHVPARFNLAILRTEQGNPEAAISLYRELLAIQPAHPQALLNLGVLLLGQGDAIEASGLIDRALQLDPSLDASAVAG